MLDGKDDRDRKWAQVGQVDKMKKKTKHSLALYFFKIIISNQRKLIPWYHL